jgi:ATP-binding cassette subfamily B protein
MTADAVTVADGTDDVPAGDRPALPAEHLTSDGHPSPWEPLAETPRYPPPRGRIAPPAEGEGWLRRVWPVVAARRVLLFGSLLAAVVALVAQVLVPAVTARAIDDGLVNRTSPLMPYVLVLLALAVTRGVLGFTYRYGMYRLAYHIETDMRAIIYRHLTTLSFSFFDRVQSGQIISRANSDIRSLQLYLAFAPLISISGLSFVLALGFMLSISVPLTVVAVVPLPFVYLVGVALRNRIFPLSWITQARTAELATIVDENINGVRVVKSFAAERRQLNELARAARRMQWANVETARARARFGPLMENLPRLALAAVLVAGGLLVIDGQIEIGALVAFNSYILMMTVPFRLLGFLLMLQQRAKASAERIYEILDEPVEVHDRPGAVDLVDACGGVELRDVRFGYGDGPDVLDGCSFAVPPGTTVAVVGATGSGKSTIVRLLPRFYDVRDGSVLVDGHDVRDLTLGSLRSQVGLVLDEPFLFSTTIRENIVYGRPDATDAEVEAAARAANAHDFIMALDDGYQSMVGERGYTLSGGQRQRIAIARALLVNPPLLVLDDATSAIDVHTEAAIHGALRALLRNRTTVVVAHRLSTIALADRVVYLRDGKVAAQGTHGELLRSVPEYRAVLAEADDPVDDAPVAGAPNPTTAGAPGSQPGGGLAGGGGLGGLRTPGSSTPGNL